jgi:CheY-like chemotaxis protein
MEGLELLHRHPVAAVILDFHMPDMAGDELAAKIRSSFPSLPIIMLSGRIGEIPPHCSGIVDGFVRKGEPASRLLTTLKDLTH